MKLRLLQIVALMVTVLFCGSMAWAGYLSYNDARTGGMKKQVLLYTLNPTEYGTGSRMPWITGDSSELYYATGNYGYEELFYSVWSAGKWQGGKALDELNIKGYSTKSPTLTPDKQRIYFSSSRPVGAPYNLAGGRWRLWTAVRQPDGSWGTPYFLNQDAVTGVNVSTRTDGHDFGVSLSRDGNTLYFNSSRTGSLGGYDVWYSVKNSQGKWQAPVNVGSPINTSSTEVSGVSVTSDNLKMYVCSDRTDKRIYGIETYNIYCAVRSSTTQAWSTSSVFQIGGISPASGNSTTAGWGVGWPCIAPDGTTLYYSDDGPFKWYGDGYSLFYSKYSGGTWSRGINAGRNVNNLIWRKTEDFLPYIAYVDATTGQPRDFMFDSFLFLALSGSSSQVRYDVGNNNKDDFLTYLDSLFAAHRQLAKFDETVGSVKSTLNQPDYRVKIAVMIPTPVSTVTNFGDVDGDGISENLSTSANRYKVVNWYLNEFFSRWSTANLKHTDLVAMYWLDEYVGTQSSLVRQVADNVHARGYKFEWIPYYSADYANWTSYRFDNAQLQPNYAWMPQSGDADPARISSSAARSRTYNLGVELEFDGRPLYDGMNFRTYLDYGSPMKENYMKDCFLGLYQDVHAMYSLAYSPLTSRPWARDAYDSLYRFLKEDYPLPVSMNKNYTISPTPGTTYPDSGHELNDYLYYPDSEWMIRSVGFNVDTTNVTYDLASVCRVEKVYGHFVSITGWGIAFPKQMSVEVSTDGVNWQSVGSSTLHPADSTTAESSGDMIVKFTPTNGRYVRVKLIRNSAWIFLDELQVYGTYNFTDLNDWMLY